MLKIKDMQNSQFFWYMPPHWLPGQKELLRVWSKPTQIDGFWKLEATCGGDYVWDLDESDQEFMFAENEMSY
jgi:hypothetical protein